MTELLRDLEYDVWSVCTADTTSLEPWSNDDVPDPVDVKPFIDEDHVDLFRRRTYIIHAQLDLDESSSSTHLTTVGTGAGPNLISRTAISYQWQHSIQPCKNPLLSGASGKLLDLLGVIPLHVTVGSLKVLVWFGVLPSLPPGVILGTSFIDRFVKSIAPPTRRIYLAGHKLVPILSTFRSRLVHSIHEPTLLDKHDDFTKHEDHEQDHCIRLAKSIRLQPNSQVLVQVRTTRSGLVHITPHWRSAHKQHVMAAHGIADFRPNEPFHIYLSNFGDHPAYLPKLMRVAYASAPPTVLVEPDHRGRGLIQEFLPLKGVHRPLTQTTPNNNNLLRLNITRTHKFTV